MISIFVFMIIFNNFYSKFVFKKVSISLLFLIQYWVWIISPSSPTCNVLIIFCLSQVILWGSIPNFSLKFKNFSNAFLQLLIFLLTKSFYTNLLHGWNFVLGINLYQYLYFCIWITFIKNVWAIVIYRNLILLLNLFY